MSTNKNIKVKKRNGSLEELQIDKIHQVIEWACEGIKGVSVSEIAIKSELKFYDKIPTSDIHKSLIDTAEELTSVEHPNYDKVASRLYNFDLRKRVYGDFNPPEDFASLFRSYVEKGIYVSDFNKLSNDLISACWNHVKHDNDYAITCYGMKQIEKKYCVQSRTTGQVYETPSMAFFRIALIGAMLKAGDNLQGDELDRAIITNFKEYYNQFALGDNSLPSPVMGGVGTPVKQFSSCTGIDVGDDLESITSAVAAIIKYASQRAGIGLNVGRIRAIGEPVRNGEVSHTGIVPMIQMFEKSVHSVSQGGMRKTAATLYFPIWHYEFPEMIVLKDNTIIEENAARHLDYGVTINGYLYKRLLKGADISLFSPNVAGGELYETFASDQQRFAELYEELEANPVIRRRTLSAEELFTRMLMSQRKETGRIYLMNIDHANEFGAFDPEVAPIHFSNLCVSPHTGILTDKGVKKIGELENEKVNVWNGEQWSPVTVVKTSDSEVLYSVCVEDDTGMELRLACTEYHRWYMADGSEKRTATLESGDALLEWVTPEGTKKTQTVKFVTNTKVESPVYCFKEELRGMGVFNGILTGNCTEISLTSKPMHHIDDYENSEIFLCTLANVNMARIKKLDELERICYNMVRFLDDLLDYQGYPVAASGHWAKKRRSLGIGVNNYAYWLAKQGFKYGEKEGLEKTHEFFEAFSFYLIKASMEIAKEKGVCEAFQDTKYAKGKMPVDRYKKEVDELGDFELKMDWDWLREQVLIHGMRNSTLMAIPPSETSATILPNGSTNGIEPIRDLVVLKSNRDLSGKVLAPEVTKLKNKYDLLWDQVTPEGYLKAVAVMQKFVDQSISANTSYNPAHYEDGNIPMSRLMKDVLLSYRWGIKNLYYQNTKKQSSTQREDNEQDIRDSMTVVNVNDPDDDEHCESCSI